MEITAKTKLSIKAENIKINAKTTIDIKAGSDFQMEGSSAAKLTASQESNYDAPKIDIELARQRAHGWKYLRLLPDRPLGGDSGRGRTLAAAKFADNCASVLFGACRKFDERHADLHDISLGAKHVGDASARRRRYFNDCLVGLDGNERLIGDDVIAFVDIPSDDLRLFETFS